MPVDNRDLDQLRMMTKVSHLYHTRGLVQTEIARTLGVSQARVSRLLSAAEGAGIVRTVVVPPQGLNADLEDRVETMFGLREVHIVDASGESESQRTETLGRALASVFRSYPIDGKTIGFTSWSRSMRRFVDNLPRFSHGKATRVVEMLGGVGQPTVQHEATTATERLARLTDAEPVFLCVPGVVPSVDVRNALLANDPFARQALDALDELDIALVGIGNATVVPPLVGGDNFFSETEFAKARKLGAVGEINLRFMGENGDLIDCDLDPQVIGITLDQLRRADQRIAVSGGESKHHALLAAVRGGWINVLVTDEESAAFLLSSGPAMNAQATASVPTIST
ncbi:MAG: sugar-binding transcriptional regulator [Actinomycetes bacterium]